MTAESTILAIARVFGAAALEIGPLFLLAIFLGAVLEEFVSNRTIERFLTGRRPATMFLASTTGALIPLCTCGMVPLAVSLRRRGSDIKHTFAFLTAGAAVSVPVLLLTWKILGPRWMAVRFLTSVVFGLLVGYVAIPALRDVAAKSAEPAIPPSPGPPPTGPQPTGPQPDTGVVEIRTRSRMSQVLRRFLGQIREYAPWVIVSLALAAVIDVLVPKHIVSILYGQRTAAGSLLAALTGVPFYFCSGAELPLVRELLNKGMGPGPGISMLLAAPIVNILTFGVVSRWLSPSGAFRYLALCVGSATILGALSGWLVAAV